jgi:transposase
VKSHDCELRYVYITHPHADHFLGLPEILAAFPATWAEPSPRLWRSERSTLLLFVDRVPEALFGRSSERAGPEAAARDEDGGGDPGRGRGGAGEGGGPRGPGARAGRRDYSHLPRVEVIWDFPGGGYCCPQCGEPFTRLGDHVAGQLDWQVTVRLVAHCHRRYRRGCRCPVPVTVMAPGPPKAIGKGLLSNGFIAMLLTERYVAGRSQNSLVTGLARHGAAPRSCINLILRQPANPAS